MDLRASKSCVPKEAARQTANIIRAIEYLECSAKSKERLDEVFEEAIKGVLKNQEAKTKERTCKTS